MSVAHNIAATAGSRVYLTLLGLLVLPIYLRMLGPEAYGLVALFFVLQVWFQLLDMGLTATLAREAARCRGGAREGAELGALLRALERLFAVVLALAAAALCAGSGLLAESWLSLDRITPAEAARAIELMALCIVARVLGELYRAAIAGFERLVWLAGCSTLFGTLRLLGVLPFLAWAGATPSNFFAYQLAVAAVETVALRVMARRYVPRAGAPSSGWGLQPLRGVLGFSLAMSLASVVWVMASQIDKLILSGLLTLADYGAFSLAVTAAAGVLLATGSLADTLVPRFTTLLAQGAAQQVSRLYRQATQWTAIVAWAAAALMACHAEHILWAWTGDAALAAQMAPVMALYAVGNAAMAVGAMPYYLQLAQGRLGLHLVGTGLMLVLLVPGLLWASARAGPTGAALVWLVVNLLYLLAWTPVAHRNFMGGQHAAWLRHDVLPAAALATACALATTALPWPAERAAVALLLLPVAAAILVAAAAGSSWAREALRQRLRATPDPGPETRTR